MHCIMPIIIIIIIKHIYRAHFRGMPQMLHCAIVPYTNMDMLVINGHQLSVSQTKLTTLVSLGKSSR